MTAVDQQQLPGVDALDDVQHRDAEWTAMRERVRKTGTCPRGTYESTLRGAQIVRRRDTDSFVLRMHGTTDRLGADWMAWQGLSENSDDPFDLTETQVKSLNRFAGRLGIATPAPAVEIVHQVEALLGVTGAVTAKVAQTVIGQTVTLSRDTPARSDPIRLTPSTSDVIVDSNGEVLEGKARDAFEAHAKLLEGLHAVHAGLARVAEGCHALHTSEGWTALGFESLAEYLASPEITVSRTEFYRLSEIWQRYVLDGGADPALLHGAAVTKLEVPLPALEAGVVSAAQAAADAESLTRKELRERYRELMGDEAGGRDAGEDSGDDGQASPESRRRDDEKVDRRDLESAQSAYRSAQDEVVRLREENDRLKHEHSLIPVTLTRSLAVMLQRVLNEVGRPEQKRMGKELRTALTELLDEAWQHGLEAESA